MGDITLNHITKIEGHARLDLKVEDGKLIECKLGSTEGSRYFEAFLKGRNWDDAPEMTSRICGICSSAHGVVSVMALEKAFGVTPTKQTLILRELQTIGERIRSHASHLYVLALPDYLGYKSIVPMAPKFGNEIKRALRIVKLGNELVTMISGRVMHQISTTVGGFLHFPSQEQLDEYKQRLIDAKDDIFETAKLIASLEVPELETDSEFFSLTREGEYATSYGDVKVNDKIFPQEDLDKVVNEYHEPYSNANFVVKEDKSIYVGSLARLNNNFDQLSPQTKEFCASVGFTIPCRNPFKNNLAQAIELIHHWESGINILNEFKVQHEEPVKFEIKAGHGIAANEAPRGTVWHEYRINDQGKIEYGRVIAPTGQSLRSMQADTAKLVQQMLDQGRSQDDIPLEVEKLIRTYDPCFSCATHFLKVNWL